MKYRYNRNLDDHYIGIIKKQLIPIIPIRSAIMGSAGSKARI